MRRYSTKPVIRQVFIVRHALSFRIAIVSYINLALVGLFQRDDQLITSDGLFVLLPSRANCPHRSQELIGVSASQVVVARVDRAGAI